MPGRGEINGRFSAQTSGAVQPFQRAAGIAPRGSLDATTLDALRQRHGCKRGRACCCGSALAETQPIAERVADFQHLPPTLLDYLRAPIAIALGLQLIAQ